MEGSSSALRMKRKSIGEVTDEFADFSLCSPATKIRRLDAELTPILEEECEIPMRFEPLVPPEQSFGSKSYGGVKIEEIQSENGERAIVLATPLDTPLRRLQSHFSLSVAPHILSGLKNRIQWSSESSSWRVVLNEEQPEYSNECLAIVPWVPSSLPPLKPAESSIEVDHSEEMMDADNADDQPSMECVESMAIDQTNVNQAGASGHPRQWQFQHCYDPQPIHSSLTPVTWYR